MGGARAVFKFRLRLHSKKAAAPTGSVSLTLVETLQNINLSTPTPHMGPSCFKKSTGVGGFVNISSENYRQSTGARGFVNTSTENYRDNCRSFCVKTQPKMMLVVLCFNHCCGSGSAWIRFFFLDRDPELLFWNRIKLKLQIKKYFILNFRPLNSGLRVLCRAVVWNRKWQKVGKLFFLNLRCVLQ